MTVQVSKDGVVRDKEGSALGYYHTEGDMSSWTREKMFDEAEKWILDCLALARKKNADYAGEGDPFMNLRRGGPFGIMVRMDDKVSRGLNLLRDMDKEAMVKDETIEDTLRDMFNYPWLCAMLMMEMREGREE